MNIKQPELVRHLKAPIPLYLLVGQDHYLLDLSVQQIKSSIKKTHACDEYFVHIQSAADWHTALQQSLSYSLFADKKLMVLFYDKSSWDDAGKAFLNAYLQADNKQCFMILQAPHLFAKSFQWLHQNPCTLVVSIYPLPEQAMKQWIVTQLKSRLLLPELGVAEIIYQHTQGNMFACAQVIEQIALCYPANSKLSVEHILMHVTDQAVLSVFELIDFCLSGNLAQCIRILRHLENNKTEAIFVLRLLSQEIRTLLLLLHHSQHNQDMKNRYTQLKIWASRVKYYELALKRVSESLLEQLLDYSFWIDQQIKSSTYGIWHALENMVLSLCKGHMEHLCIV